MVSGLASNGWLLARGKSMFTEFFSTGTVMMKMISSTSITSTMGVTLISFITSSVSSWVPKAMGQFLLNGNTWRQTSGLFHRDNIAVAAGGNPRARHEVGVQVVREAAQLDQNEFVAAYQGVVAQYRRNRDGQSQRGHDQRFAHRPRDLIDAGLAARADAQQCMVNAPDGTEQPHERRGGADRSQNRQPRLQLGRKFVDGVAQAA